MTVLDARAAPVAYGTARLLAGVTSGRPADLARHREHHGEQRFNDQAGLASLADQVRLLGRGGAAFPVGTKLRSTPYGAATHVLVNGAESEPASQKDRTLMRLAPHLVLDGALEVARALGTTRVTVAVHDRLAATALTAAVRERRDATHVRVVVQDGGFVSGEVRSVIRSLDGGPAVPPGRRVLPHERGVDGAPTYASNVETFAQLALLSSLGADRFAEVGSPEEPGTLLLTLVGDVPHPGVVEVPTGLPLSVLLPDQDVDPRPVLVGGYHGSWVSDVSGLTLTRPALRAAGLPLNAGVVARLSHDTCALGEVAAVSSWLAGQSAGQCGPCYFGLPTVARDVHELWRGQDPGVDLLRRVAQLPGRGACAHPDGSAMFVRTALATLAREVEAHRRDGTCGRPWRRELPTGGAA
ncbi:NADH-ubiquinone oxidoreductase-F iron-sulfur binding region domain-containing protein [Nocardioides sp. CN2-186]|uniref:NADH-ubiquinone oxidoreductase-F iron-sulfur binding region domain-containing protein n=1 Tax=Nocardioides tweenelious TaxID=3156607 RepID=UPI0032B4A426